MLNRPVCQVKASFYYRMRALEDLNERRLVNYGFHRSVHTMPTVRAFMAQVVTLHNPVCSAKAVSFPKRVDQPVHPDSVGKSRVPAFPQVDEEAREMCGVSMLSGSFPNIDPPEQEFLKAANVTCICRMRGHNIEKCVAIPELDGIGYHISEC